MQSKTKLLKECVEGLVLEVIGPRKLRVFDFDDTLAQTGSKVWVIRPDGSRKSLLPGEFAVYQPTPDEQFDFTEFGQLIEPKAYVWTGRVLKNIYDKYGPSGVVILTARHATAPIHQFLHQAGFDGIEVIALGTSNPQAKANWIDARIVRDDLHLIEFFDDSSKNVEAVRALQDKHPDVKVIARHIVHQSKPMPHPYPPLQPRSRNKI
jgi:SAM-dependent methyltransferase